MCRAAAEDDPLRDRLGRRPGGRADPYRPPELPAGKVNTTDPDSRSIPVGLGFVQDYNAQASVNEQGQC
jgi:hypothetical protein